MIQPTKHIRDLIARFLERRATDSEIDELHQWLQQGAEHREYFDSINESYQASTVLDQFNPEKIDKAWLRVSSMIDEDQEVKKRHTLISQNYYNFLRIAASVSLLFAVTFLLWKFLPGNSKATSENIIVYTPQGRSTRIFLPDSSSVWLNANSTLQYSSDFGENKREVILKGEGFFDVRKKQGNQFIVKTDQLSVHVKGTRFNVRAYAGEDANTTLEEGKVELTVAGVVDPISMIPGDQITVEPQKGTVTLKKVNPSNFTAWKEEKLTFDNTPLADIIQKLENRFKVDIVIDDSIAQRERLTMTITQETMDEILEMIQLSSRLNYKKEHDKILIYE